MYCKKLFFSLVFILHLRWTSLIWVVAFPGISSQTWCCLSQPSENSCPRSHRQNKCDSLKSKAGCILKKEQMPPSEIYLSAFHCTFAFRLLHSCSYVDIRLCCSHKIVSVPLSLLNKTRHVESFCLFMLCKTPLDKAGVLGYFPVDFWKSLDFLSGTAHGIRNISENSTKFLYVRHQTDPIFTIC